MNALEEICFKIISLVGSARSSYVEAIREAKQGRFEVAEQKMNEGNASYRAGHAQHANLVQLEASGEKVELNLLLMHSEDQMMSAEVLGIVAQELIDLYKLR